MNGKTLVNFLRVKRSPMGPEVVSGKKMGEDSFHGSLVGCVKHVIPGLQGYRAKG